MHREMLSKALNRMAPQVNKYLRDEICRNLDRAEYTNWLEYDLAFSRMQFYFSRLKVKSFQGFWSIHTLSTIDIHTICLSVHIVRLRNFMVLNLSLQNAKIH